MIQSLLEIAGVVLLRFPLPIRVWALFVAAVNLTSVLFLDVLEGQVVLLALILALVIMAVICKRFGFVRLLGLGHVTWLVMLPWLYLRLIKCHSGLASLAFQKKLANQSFCLGSFEEKVESMRNTIIKVAFPLAILFLAIVLYRTVQRNEAGNSLPPRVFTSVDFVPEAIDTRPVSTSNPKAIQILTLLKDLASQPKVLSGTNIGNASFRLDETYQMSVVDLEKETGKFPAILSVDYLWEKPIGDFAAVNKILTEHVEKGGIVTVNMHPGSPFVGGLYNTGTGEFSFEDLFVQGTKPYETWRSVLSHVGDGLEELEDDGVVVLFRPLH